jgi:hypothetical protein
MHKQEISQEDKKDKFYEIIGSILLVWGISMLTISRARSQLFGQYNILLGSTLPGLLLIAGSLLLIYGFNIGSRKPSS